MTAATMTKDETAANAPMPTQRPSPPKALPPDFMGQRADHFFAQWFVNVEHRDVELRDLFLPAFWRHHVQKLRRHDLVRVVARDFDVVLAVDELVGFGARMRPHNWVRPGSATQRMLDELSGPSGPAAESQALADVEVAGMTGGPAS